MIKYFSLIVFLTFSSYSFAYVDIDKACNEKEEQKNSLLTRMSTSLIEAHLAGQCTGYNNYNLDELIDACAEFVEQKESLIPSLSTSILEANLSGICVGAIYRIAIKKCDQTFLEIKYLDVAKAVVLKNDVSSIQYGIRCY